MSGEHPNAQALEALAAVAEAAARAGRRVAAAAEALAGSLPLIREDGLPHHAEYDPQTGRSTCLADCPSCNANKSTN